MVDKPVGTPVFGEEMKPEEYAIVEGEMLYASSSAVQGTGTEYVIVFSRARPMTLKSGLGYAPVAKTETVAIVSFSPQALKDLHLAIGDQIAGHEKEFGEIVTPYMRQRAHLKQVQ